MINREPEIVYPLPTVRFAATTDRYLVGDQEMTLTDAARRLALDLTPQQRVFLSYCVDNDCPWFAVPGTRMGGSTRRMVNRMIRAGLLHKHLRDIRINCRATKLGKITRRKIAAIGTRKF